MRPRPSRVSALAKHPACYAALVAEIALSILVVGVLFIADPDRLQLLIERLRELSVWLAE